MRRLGRHDTAYLIACATSRRPRHRERWSAAQINVIALMPHLSHLQVYDNSRDVEAGDPIPDPTLVLEMIAGRCAWPNGAESMEKTPEWAKALVGAALPQVD